ncbi:YozQ family protein [Bacillus sp. ISL-47]|uniref:YozQ family protein n=1 Tax=Bacillus sp. ISL-47 TaxID=2819130 RepID=UPI001BE8D37E|nr:YozQ family protein [Bacillus sp. ISL-47]MBT2689485.1 YozQ family protein [Bacillus sp. ISL-47]MBT2708303.1 YozQ family protein [Pseudomonas sp. ISL-84]
MDKKDSKDSANIAGRYYETEDYKRSDQLSSGLATTHEQVSDTYMEGQADAVIEDVVGVDISIPHKGYDE